MGGAPDGGGDGDDSDEVASFGRSSSAPSLGHGGPRRHLGPLEPPPTCPFGLDWMQNEPSEFAWQRETESRRKAVKLLNIAYRHAAKVVDGVIEEVGEDFPEGRGQHRRGRSGPSSVYRYPPLPLQAQRMSSEPPAPSTPSSSSFGAHQRMSQTAPPSVGAGAEDGRRRTLLARSASAAGPLPAPLLALEAGRLRRKETTGKLFDWGKCGLGGPYTLGQVFEEIEADVRHRKPRDLRASGTLGAAQLGAGASRLPRELPQLRRRPGPR